MSLSPLSSPGGTRDVLLDLTAMLEPAETLSTVTVTPADATALEVTNAAVTTAEQTVDGKTVAIGKGVEFSIETLRRMRGSTDIEIDFVGSAGTAEGLRVAANVVPRRVVS